MLVNISSLCLHFQCSAQLINPWWLSCNNQKSICLVRKHQHWWWNNSKSTHAIYSHRCLMQVLPCEIISISCVHSYGRLARFLHLNCRKLLKIVSQVISVFVFFCRNSVLFLSILECWNITLQGRNFILYFTISIPLIHNMFSHYSLIGI